LAVETAARSFNVAPITESDHSDIEIETAIMDLGSEPGGGRRHAGSIHERASGADHIGELRVGLAQGPWPQILAVDLLVPAAERIEHGDAVGAGYFLTSFAATSVTALQVNSTKS
jgi:hypothetical protein